MNPDIDRCAREVKERLGTMDGGVENAGDVDGGLIFDQGDRGVDVTHDEGGNADVIESGGDVEVAVDDEATWVHDHLSICNELAGLLLCSRHQPREAFSECP